MAVVYTVGHSNQTLEAFLELLKGHQVEVLVDVRTSPISAYAPHFNKAVLEKQLPLHGITYRFMGEELGGRPSEREYYDARGFVLYGRMARSFAFRQGIEKLLMVSEQNRLAIMCSEENPAICHRHLLIARVLTDEKIDILHIRGNGTTETYQQVVSESEAGASQAQSDLFDSAGEEQWKSIRSVLRENPQEPSLGY